MVGGAQAQDSINITTYGGAFAAAVNEAYARPFTEATGIQANMVDNSDPPAKLKAEVEAGNVTSDVYDVEQSDVDRYVDLGQSGADTGREQFTELVDAIGTNEYEYVVVWEISRLARLGSIYQRFFEECEQAGTTVVIVGHRPSTLAQADRVLMLREGRLHMFGPRADVIERLTRHQVQAVPAKNQPVPQTAS